jgi:excisionase family DNA binding protein
MVLTPRAAARYIGVSHSTVHKWLNLGFLPGTRIGDRWFLRRGELDLWSSGQTKMATS